MASARGHKAYHYPRKSYCVVRSGISSDLIYTLSIKKQKSQFCVEVLGKTQAEKDRLFKVYEDNRSDIESETGLEFEVRKEGERNPDWGRVLVIFDYKKSVKLKDQAEFIGEEFIKVIEAFKKVFSK